MNFPALLAVADRAALMLGGPVVYSPTHGDPVSVQGVFDIAYVRIDQGTPGVQSVSPAVFFRLEDLPSDPSEDDPAVTANGVRYTVREAKPDGLGGVLLLLEEA